MKVLIWFFYFYSGAAWSFQGSIDAWKNAEKMARFSFQKAEQKSRHAYDEYERNQLRLWGELETTTSKTLLSFSKNQFVKIVVDYEKGTVQVKALKDKKQTLERLGNDIKESLSTVIKDDQDLMAPIKGSEIEKGRSSVAEFLSDITRKSQYEGKILGKDGVSREVFGLKFNLVPDFVQKRALALLPTVEKWANHYNLDPAFVLAIIRQESAFNPQATSWVPAYGLMQIVPKYAGQEVNFHLNGARDLPPKNLLFIPDENIKMGTKYLQLLRDQYFSAIPEGLQKQFAITCAYNWGPYRVNQAIEKGRLKMDSSALKFYQTLKEITPAETRDYLEKVTRYHEEFKRLLNERSANG